MKTETIILFFLVLFSSEIVAQKIPIYKFPVDSIPVVQNPFNSFKSRDLLEGRERITKTRINRSGTKQIEKGYYRKVVGEREVFGGMD